MSRAQAACSHLGEIRPVKPSGQGCKECLEMGDTWVHLRECLSCGHIGCCDSSKNKHATKHFPCNRLSQVKTGAGATSMKRFWTDLGRRTSRVKPRMQRRSLLRLSRHVSPLQARRSKLCLHSWRIRNGLSSNVRHSPCVTLVIFSLLSQTNKLPLMKRVPAPLFLLLSVLVPATFGQQEQTESSRKIVNRVMPQYPAMARTMNLRGSVKAEAVVQPNGFVKSVEVKGGHPVLVRAAQDAIYKWKWAPRLTRPGSQSKSSSIPSNAVASCRVSAHLQFFALVVQNSVIVMPAQGASHSGSSFEGISC